MSTYQPTQPGSPYPLPLRPPAAPPLLAPVVPPAVVHRLKLGVWAYFFLLIFEGALRKWFLPGLASPLLVVRDPLVVWLLLAAVYYRLFPINGYTIGSLLIGFVSMFTAVLLGHGSLPVAVFGSRILLLHVPLVFVIGQLFTPDDVVKLGRLTLWIALPMTVLIALQFYSPQSAWVNRGIGGDTEGAGFSGALDFFRPPGTFSFTSGNSLFYGLVACYVLYFWLHPERINRLLLLGATVALLAALPLSISRTLLFELGLSMAFAGVAVLFQPRYARQMGLMAGGAVLALLVLSQTDRKSVV